MILFFLYFLVSLLPAYKISQKPFLAGAHLRIAHRCGSKNYPENTLFACKSVFHKALVDILEIDVRMTRDKELVVIHDNHLERTTNGSGMVEELNYPKIIKYDAGFYFTQNGKDFPYRGRQIRIRKLEEFFIELPMARYSIELKTKSIEAGILLGKIIKKYHMEDRVVLGSFDGEPIRGVRQNLPYASYYANFWQVIGWYFTRALRIPVLYTGDFAVITLPDPAYFSFFLEQTKKEGRLLFIWTINDSYRMKELIDLGVHGIMTDDVYLLNQVYYSK